MKPWTWMMGGLIVWAAHFLGIYILSSLADVVATADDPTWRAIALVFSVACAIAAATLLWLAARRLRRAGDASRFQDQLAALGSGLGCVAIVWQALPTLIGY